MKTNEAGLNLIKEFEGCRLKAYQDSVGIWTIGYGHTGVGINQSTCITQEQADEFLAKDLEHAELGISRLVGAPINENQFAALVAFSFNVGLGNFAKSHLLIKVNKQDFAGAADEFLRWDRAGGIEVPGLLRRRQAERALFLS